MVRFFIYVFILSLLSAGSAYAKLKVTADRTVLSSNESFTLEIESDQSGGRPNLSVLEKDFEIISQNHSQNFTIINGKSSRKNIWTILLMPKSSGQITLPSIQFGQDSSQPIHLVVHQSVNPLQDPQAKNATNQDVFINVSLEPKEQVYVQQQLTLSIQIFTRINLSNLSLSSIQIDEVLLEQIGEDKQYTKIINQQSYQVIERQYALFPQKSGTLEIPGLRFEAMKVNQRSSNWPFFSNQGQPIHRQSDALKIKVMPKPANFVGQNWLPAQHLRVQSQAAKIAEIKVGDSFTITDKIIAQGVLGSLLPSIKFPIINGLKLYPDKAQISSESYNGKIIGQREEKIAIIATRPGLYTIPERRISWWNTQTHQQQEEVIPGFDIKVIPVAGVNSTAVPSSTTNTQIPTMPTDNEFSLSNVETKIPLLKNPWFWSTLCLAILYLLSVIMILIWKRRFNPILTSDSQKTTDLSDRQNQQKRLLNELSYNCKNNLANETMQTLIQWFNLYFHKRAPLNFSSLSEIVAKVGDQNLSNAINQLDAAIYAPNCQGNWKGESLDKALKSFIRAKNKQQDHDIYKLPPLNPI